ncbi:unnamed protein product [Prunus armeniaca]
MTTPEASLVLSHSSSTSTAQPPTSSVPQIVTIQNDNSALPTGVILNETNYALWSQLMEIRIATRGKLGYLTGSIAMPAESAPTFDGWTTENLRVKGRHSPSNRMANLFPNIIACFRVFFRNWIIATPHLWCALLTLMQTRKNSTIFEFIFFFLDWIPNPEFDQVRSEILRKELKLDLDQSFAYVRCDAQQRANFTGVAAYLDATIMVAQRSKGPLHLMGVPRLRGDPPVSGNKSNEHTSASAFMATSGTTGYALNVSSTSLTSNVWVIDSSASDHMTCDSNKIISLSPYSQSVVSNANSSSSHVVGEGSLFFTDSLHLDSVLVDILTRKIIGYGTRRGKLYFLDLAPSGETRISQAFKTSGDPTEKNQNFIWLWHRRLVVRASLFDAQMPRYFWGEAVCSAAYLINRVPSSVLNFQTPLQAFPQQVGALSTQMRVYWLCPTSKRAHVSPNTIDDQFDLEGFVSLCHPTVQDALIDSSDTTPETMHESLDDRSRLVSSPTTQSPDQGEKNDVLMPVSEVSVPFNQLSSEIHLQPYQLPIRKNCGIPKIQYKADPKAKVKYPISNHVSTHRLSAPYAMLIKQLDSLSTPSSVEEALMDPNWKQEMSDEMQALQKNSTWELVPLPSGKRTVGCRWIYTIKLKVDGSIERYKARLVAKEYTQRYGVDYQETFALVAKINTHKENKITALIVYVDDMIVTGDDPDERKALQEYLSKEFEMKDLGTLKYFLGIEVSRSQQGMLGCKPVNSLWRKITSLVSVLIINQLTRSNTSA